MGTDWYNDFLPVSCVDRATPSKSDISTWQRIGQILTGRDNSSVAVSCSLQ
jgi:hypothetical protein